MRATWTFRFLTHTEHIREHYLALPVAIDDASSPSFPTRITASPLENRLGCSSALSVRGYDARRSGLVVVRMLTLWTRAVEYVEATLSG